MLRVTLLQDASVLISQFPECPIWKHPLFSNPLFLEFKELVVSRCAEYLQNPALNISQLVPEVAHAIHGMNSNVVGSLGAIDVRLGRVESQLSALVSSNETQMTQIDDLPSALGPQIASALSGMHLKFFPNETAHSVTLPRSNLTNVPDRSDVRYELSEGQVTAQSTVNIPAYNMSRQNLTSVLELCVEWYSGFNGDIELSIQNLEAKYGSAWRGGSTTAESKYYLSRKLIIDLVEEQVAQGTSLQAAIDSVQVQCDELGGTLHKLTSKLRSDKRERARINSQRRQN
jgi:hypothetical protein